MKTKIAKRYSVFNVYLLDMWGNKEDGFEENQRILVGKIHVPAPTLEEVSEEGILRAMKKLMIEDISGRKVQALETRNRKVVYIEDLYGTGLWWEIGEAGTRKPIFGVKFVGEYVS